MRAAVILVALAGCSNWFGIDKIAYEGPAIDATVGGGDSGGDAAAIDALGPTSTLTITFQGSGMVGFGATSCTNLGPPCVTVFATGAQIQLVPAGANSSLFSYWDGACLSQNDFVGADSTPVCQLTMNGDKHVVAWFTSDFVLNMIPSSTNTTDVNASLTNSSPGQSGVKCVSGQVCTLDFALAAPPLFQIAGSNDQPCAIFGTFTGQACQLGSDSCPITFPSGAHVLNVEYNFDLGPGGPTCTTFK